MTKPPLIIHVNMGAGDHILTVAIVRHYAHIHSNITIPVKPHNRELVKFMFRDLKNVSVLEARDHREAEQLCQSTSTPVLRLGQHGKQPFDHRIFDQEFFRQAGIPFEDRWCMWYVQPPLHKECVIMPWMDEPYTFVHDDKDRGFVIEGYSLPPRRTFWVDAHKRIDPQPHIFAYWAMIKNAWEIHCIDSSFAILIDSMDTPKCQRYVLHRSARKGITEWPTYRKPWEVV